MDREYALIFLPAVSWILWGLGGKWNKLLRRALLPIIYGITCYLYQKPLTICIYLTAWSMLVFWLGYGETKSWLWRGFVGYLYGTIHCFLAYTAWVVIIPIAWLLMFAFSNSNLWDWLKKIFTWKVVEGLIGLLIGLSIALQL